MSNAGTQPAPQPAQQERPPRPASVVAVNSSPAMSGHFATLFSYSWMDGWPLADGGYQPGMWFPEPEETSFGRHASWQDANREGEQWAKELGLEFHPATQASVEAALESSKRFVRKTKLFRRLLAMGVERSRAFALARGKYPNPA